jgi:hypothetical protein
MNLKASFVDFLDKKYPHLGQDVLNSTISENLLSPFQIQLTSETIQSIKDEIKAYWKLRQWGVESMSSQYEQLGLRKPPNFGVCMSYDFHISSEKKLELIEINTNASFLALGLQLYEFLKLPNTASDFDEKKLVEMFLAENKLNTSKPLELTILDQSPEKQRLYLEFLIYQSIFNKHSIPTTIADIGEIEKLKKSSLVYNRYTDFYLKDEGSSAIKELFNQSQIQLSPNPYEYFLLADKERFIDWHKQNEIAKPASLLPTYDLGLVEKEKVWSERKQLFFKPKNAYGGKQAYRGASMSQKIFDEVTNSHFIAQKMSAAPEIEVEFNKNNLKFKYDLRCYAYKDQLQLIIARLYQGQTTNLKTEGGGFACIITD